MKYTELISPDKFVGQLLGLVKSRLELLYHLVTHPTRDGLRTVSLICQIKPRYTMVQTHSLLRLKRLIEDLNQRAIPGHVVECGTWNGGSAALMAALCKEDRIGSLRSFWLFDSFQGMPEPSDQDGAQSAWYFKGWLKASQEKVFSIFTTLGIAQKRIHVISGWFQDTLHQHDPGPTALLHIDADWYESVKICLDTYYDLVVPGGYIIFDDYGYIDGCGKAINEFVSRHGLVLFTDGKYGAYLQKPTTTEQASEVEGGE